MIYVIIHFSYGDRPFSFGGMSQQSVEALCADYGSSFSIVTKAEYDTCLASLPAIA